MFRALLAHPHEALHKRHLIYCVRVLSAGCTSILVQPTDITRTQFTECHLCRASWRWASSARNMWRSLMNWIKSASRWFHYTDVVLLLFIRSQCSTNVKDSPNCNSAHEDTSGCGLSHSFQVPGWLRAVWTASKMRWWSLFIFNCTWIHGEGGGGGGGGEIVHIVTSLKDWVRRKDFGLYVEGRLCIYNGITFFLSFGMGELTPEVWPSI
jgi:hypothetical protein